MTENPLTALDDRLAARLLEQRTLVLGSALDDTLGNRLCAALILLATEDPTSDIYLWINSPGGSVPAMLAIRDTMRLIPNTVRTVNLGMAYSAGQFLLSAGSPGSRFALAHSRVLLHQGSAGFGGSAGDVAIQADGLRSTRDTVLALIAADTGQDVAQVERDSRRDRWFGAEEALGYGFVDRVVTSLDEIRPRPRQAIGLGAAA
ncbi:ATP-dependent Clp protease proteolytic subunit [Tessaracoccus aquimaris]|uniref:ATP-dependent Clp protease proteolytic subunit n=1 Tax=Tessaracoccus aquimaris TaxID=1332264 RepID=A0A1Q2CKT7_9ACTN|nr:ATP-dependent Clp protease proteolytic subunit [Tessaracoccus aquimaris]AQP46711.1 ATP-dependent Clp protease proteolytic subunit [Tessaracoccus aquimaris]